MSSFYRVLREKFSLLESEYPEAKLEDVTATDVYYTDGMAADAKFKIVFSKHEKYLTTVYVKDDGGWFSTVENYVIKLAMKAWIAEAATPELSVVDQ